MMKNQKGITLIALVITIIVMLILVTVTVTMALNGGLFNQAKTATNKTKTEAERENNLDSGNANIGGKEYNISDYANDLNVTTP